MSRLDGGRKRPTNIQRAGKWIYQNGQRSTAISGDQSKRDSLSPVDRIFLLCGCIIAVTYPCPLGGLQPTGHRWTCATECRCSGCRWPGCSGSCGHWDDESGEGGWGMWPRPSPLLRASEQNSQSSVKDGHLQSEKFSVNVVSRFSVPPSQTSHLSSLWRWFFPHQMWQDTCPWPRVLTT